MKSTHVYHFEVHAGREKCIMGTVVRRFTVCAELKLCVSHCQAYLELQSALHHTAAIPEAGNGLHPALYTSNSMSH